MTKSNRNAPRRAVMADREPVRRASYGAASPVVGVRGARTREQIIDAALLLFGERGVNGTVVDDIARAVGISRATLYQYFGSKEELFRELVEASGSAQIRVMRRLGRLGPTAEGFDNLHWWLGEVAWVYEKYATLFVQWANVDTPEGPLRPMLGRFLETYTGRLAERLVEGGVTGVDAGDLAIALWSMIERFNYYRHTRVTGLTDDAAVDNLAIVAQLIVFPETPSAVLTAVANSIMVGRNRAQAPRKFKAMPDWKPRDGRFASLSDEAFATVSDILDAGARLFASSGYHNTSVNMIIREGARSRGTFYKYFDGKLDLLVVLARQCAEEVRELSDRLKGVSTSAELRVWLARLPRAAPDPFRRLSSVARAGRRRSSGTRDLGRRRWFRARRYDPAPREHRARLPARSRSLRTDVPRAPGTPARPRCWDRRRTADGPPRERVDERDGARLPQRWNVTTPRGTTDIS